LNASIEAKAVSPEHCPPRPQRDRRDHCAGHHRVRRSGIRPHRGRNLGGRNRGFDESILLALREPGDPTNPIGPAWLEHALLDITALGGYVILSMLVIGVAIDLIAAGKRGTALLVVGAVGSGTLLSETLKFGFARPRPDLVAHLAEVQSASFPSGHAMISAIAYLTLGVLLTRVHKQRRTKIIIMSYAILLTLMIGLSRIYLGVHWPTDVLAGWALGRCVVKPVVARRLAAPAAWDKSEIRHSVRRRSPPCVACLRFALGRFGAGLGLRRLGGLVAPSQDARALEDAVQRVVAFVAGIFVHLAVQRRGTRTRRSTARPTVSGPRP